MKYLILTINAIAALYFSGCAVINLEKYYAPSNQDNKTDKYQWHNHILDSGPNNTAIIYEDKDCYVKVRIDYLTMKTLYVGPLYFPIIPIFTDEELMWPKNDKLNVVLNATMNIFIIYDFSTCMLIMEDHTILYPENVETDFIYNKYVLTYSIQGNKFDSFILSFGQMILNGNMSISPMIPFHKTEAYTYSVGP